jgi:hypothetical protein
MEGWFAGRLPEAWGEGAPEVVSDRDEILVVVRIADVELGDASEDERRAAREGRIARFREETREERMRIAREAEGRFGRKVSWGAECGGLRVLFTHLATPVMTRLRIPERKVLDTLVEAGVARSRSHALAWCVRLVGDHEKDWIEELRAALVAVENARASGPRAS